MSADSFITQNTRTVWAFSGPGSIGVIKFRGPIHIDCRGRPRTLCPVMPSIPIHDLIPVLQVAIGPVILISGVGLLLLTLTNRLGRAVDRSRAQDRQLREDR